MIFSFFASARRLPLQALAGLILLSTAIPLYAAQVTLSLSAITNAEGYQVYRRQEGATYQYGNPVWTGTGTSCTISDLADNTTYYFVARAYAGNSLSPNSNEVSFLSPIVPPAAVTYTISANAGANGSIQPSGNINVAQDGSQAFNIIADPGYHMDQLTVDGVSIGSMSNYSFSSISANHSITASFIIDAAVNPAPVGKDKIWLEAEEGDVYSPMQIAADPKATDGGYVYAPADSVSMVQTPGSSTGLSEYAFEAPSDGDYVIWGRVNANSSTSDSFYVAVDETNYLTWHVLRTDSGGWAWDVVSKRNESDVRDIYAPFIYHLKAGFHKLSFGTRETGTQIDRILITNVLGYLPSGMGEPSGVALISKKDWQLVSVDSEELVGEDGAVVNIYDNNPATIWHTQWKNASPANPHELVIDLGLTCQLDGFTLLPRQDGSINGRITNYEFYVSNYPDQWPNPIAVGSFADNATEKLVTFSSTVGRYIRLIALSSANGNPWSSAAEIGVIGVPLADNLAPDGTIDEPAADLTIHAGSAVVFSGSGTDADGDTPLSYQWQFGAGSGIEDYTTDRAPGAVVFDTPGTFTVTFTVTDSEGKSDPAPASRVITVAARSAKLSKTDWRLVSVDSQELVGEDGAAVNAFDDDPATFWHSQWKYASPAHPHELVIDLGATYALDGFTMLPRQDGSINGRIINYKFYVGHYPDQWFVPVAEGSFANNAAEKSVTFNSTVGRYIRLVALTSANGNPWSSAAEIGVSGMPEADNLAPDGTIDEPAGDMTIQAGSAVVFSGSGTDADGDTPLSYQWQFGQGSGIADYSLDDAPGAVVFNTPGTFTVVFTVKDFEGKPDPTPASCVITVTVNNAKLPKADWRLVSVDSEELVGEDGAAVNAFDDNPVTFWHTQWKNASPNYPHELVIDLGATCRLEGFSMLPRQDGKINGRVTNYAFYVGANPYQWAGPASSGSFADTPSEQEVSFGAATGRYIRLVALSSANNAPWTSLAEIGVTGMKLESAP